MLEFEEVEAEAGVKKVVEWSLGLKKSGFRRGCRAKHSWSADKSKAVMGLFNRRVLASKLRESTSGVFLITLHYKHKIQYCKQAVFLISSKHIFKKLLFATEQHSNSHGVRKLYVSSYFYGGVDERIQEKYFVKM